MLYIHETIFGAVIADVPFQLKSVCFWEKIFEYVSKEKK